MFSVLNIIKFETLLRLTSCSVFHTLYSLLSASISSPSIFHCCLPVFPSPPSLWFVQSRCHAVLCGSSGDELPLLVNRLFILQPYQPHCRVSSRQLQSRSPALIMSSDQALHTNAHTVNTHTDNFVFIQFTSSLLSHQHVYPHTDSHTYTLIELTESWFDSCRY